MRLRRLALGLLTVTLPVFASAAAIDPAATKLIDSASKGELKILESFESIDNLKGYVVEPRHGGRQAVVYVDKAGHYLIAGNIIDAKGVNITEQDMRTYVYAKQAVEAYKGAAQQSWFAEGSDKAPHKVYILIDPNCIFCHLIYKELQPYLDKGELQVRWIPVGFLKPTSQGKAAKILSGKDDAEKVKFLKQDELGFDRAHESGGIEPLKRDDKDMTNAKLFSEVEANSAYFKNSGFQGTPTLLYINRETNKPGFYPGFLKGDQLKQAIEKMSDHW